MSRTSRGRRVLPLSLSEVDGMRVGWEGALGCVVGGGGPAAWLVGAGSVGGLMGWVGGGWVLFGDAILRGVSGLEVFVDG